MSSSNKPLHIKLKELREAHGLSQREVANHLNISRQAISQWENQKAYPDIDNIVLLCELYQISSDELLDIGERQDTNTLLAPSNNTSEEKKNYTIEQLCLAISLFFTSCIPFLGIFTPIIILFFMRHLKRKNKTLYILCIVCFCMGIYNTYVLTKHFIF